MATDLRTALLAARAVDGGFGAHPGGPSEPEPTAMAAIALDDRRALAWLVERQSADGGWPAIDAPDAPVNESANGFAAIAVGAGPVRERALDRMLAIPGQALTSTAEVPLDPTRRGWGWTPATAGWVDPTSRALLALRLYRPSATPAIDDAIGFLADRACVDGGWNYGNRVVLDVTLEPYAHPTAVALIALHGLASPVVDKGREALDRLWPRELGGLSLAVTLAAFRLLGVDRPRQAAVARELDARVQATGLLGDTVALAWASIATSDAVETLRVRS